MARMAEYPDAILWIVRNKAGGRGWPPRDHRRVAGWWLTRFVAAVFKRSVARVAEDIVEVANDLRDADANKKRRSGRAPPSPEEAKQWTNC